MSLWQARVKARQARVLLDKQQDPLSVRRAAVAEQRQRGSFRELCEEWYRSEVSFGAGNRLALTLLLALGVRKGELLGARWEEFDLDGGTPQGAVWHLPASRTKTGAALDVPLASTVVGWLREHRALCANSEHLFPKRRRDRRERVPHVGLDTLNAALQPVKHGLRPFTLHDLRRTARTQLAALGVRREVAERCLGHAIRGVEGTYDRHDYFKERRAALEQWSGVLMDAERGVRKIVPMREPRARSST